MNKIVFCVSLIAAASLWMIGCGGDLECVAGEEQCVGMQVRVCAEDGTWGAAEDCDAGTCMDMGQGDQCMDMGDDDDSAN